MYKNEEELKVYTRNSLSHVPKIKYCDSSIHAESSGTTTKQQHHCTMLSCCHHNINDLYLERHWIF